MKAIALALGGAGAAVVLGLTAPAASAQSLPACGRYPVAEATYSCTCPANPAKSSIWGSGPYTADSDLCTAAIHAGALSQAGGPIMAIRLDGMAEYPGSERNGVTSSRWGRYDTSIIFGPVTAGGPAPTPTPTPTPTMPTNPFPTFPNPFPTAPTPTPPATPPSPFPAGPAPTPTPTPSPFPSLAPTGTAQVCTLLSPDIETRCTCEPNGGNGPVWGSGPYTSDSDLCTAARHAGAIGLSGGEISVIRVPGLTSYKATERNGVATMEWGEYGESFIVNVNN